MSPRARTAGAHGAARRARPAPRITAGAAHRRRALLARAGPEPEDPRPGRPGQNLRRARGARPVHPRRRRSRAGRRRGAGGGRRPRARRRQRLRHTSAGARVHGAAAAPRMTRAALMITCLADVFYPEVGERIVRLLRGLDVEVTLPPGQTCCGLPLFNSGYHAEAAAVARRTVTIFRDAEAVVVPSGSCAWMVKHEYPGLLRGQPESADAERLAGRTYEFSQFLVRRLRHSTFESAVEGPLA